MALLHDPDAARWHGFFSSLPACPHGCPNDRVYPSPTFRPGGPDDTVTDQTSAHIERYRIEVRRMLEDHLGREHDVLTVRDKLASYLSLAGYRQPVAVAELLLAEHRAEIAAEVRAMCTCSMGECICDIADKIEHPEAS